MPGIDPYLTFDGNCSDAMHFYARVLGGTVEREMKFKDMPGAEPPAPDIADQTMHMAVRVGDRVLMGSDCAGMPFDGRRGISLSLDYPDIDEGRRVFEALAEGGQVTMPFAPQFWVEMFGMVEDRFGTSWMVNAGKPAF